MTIYRCRLDGQKWEQSYEQTGHGEASILRKTLGMVQTWEGDWETRIYRRIQERGHSNYHEYLEARQGQSYHQMAQELGKDVAPVQMARLHVLNTKDGYREQAIVDSFARYLRGTLRKGWGIDRHWKSAVLGALSSWYVTWNSGSDLDAFQREVFLLSPEPGWIPRDSKDPILSEAARRVWSRPLDEDNNAGPP